MDHSGKGRLLEPAVTTPPPLPETQLLFLTKLQRLFNESDFVATYKYALLMALAELSVEYGSDSGDQLVLSHRQIAIKFIELYWQQSAPYSSGRPGTIASILFQNTGNQAAVITAINAFRQTHAGATLWSARSVPAFSALVARVARTVADQPIRYLQNLGGKTDAFLYERRPQAVCLLPNVAFCFRRFQPLVNQLARTHWVQHVKRNRHNLPVLGDADDLEEFLFETPRLTLSTVAAGLRKITNGRCFYCRDKGQTEVDHFIPFALYPRDLMHNFVLAHPACNRSKSDTLAAKVHLDHWLDFTDHYTVELVEVGKRAGVIADITASLAVTRWGYEMAAASGAQAWLKAGKFEPITSVYLSAVTGSVRV
jgi:5-methylcytosine-specific restriction endonuclease McrA